VFLRYDGVLGYGWDPEGDLTPGPNAAPVVNWFAVRGFAKPSIRLWIGTLGVASLNSLKETAIGPHYVPFVSSPLGVPVFNINGFRFSDYADTQKTPAIVDSGYSVIALPAMQFRIVYAIVAPDYDWETGLYTVDCGDQTVRPPKLVFQVDGKSLVVRQELYLRDFNADDERCIFAVAQSVEESLYHLGLPFVHTYVTYWDAYGNQMGFEKNRVL